MHTQINKLNILVNDYTYLGSSLMLILCFLPILNSIWTWLLYKVFLQIAELLNNNRIISSFMRFTKHIVLLNSLSKVWVYWFISIPKKLIDLVLRFLWFNRQQSSSIVEIIIWSRWGIAQVLFWRKGDTKLLSS